MAKDINGEALTVGDWVTYTDPFFKRMEMPETLTGQIASIVGKDGDWLRVDWANSSLKAPVFAVRCAIIHP